VFELAQEPQQEQENGSNEVVGNVFGEKE